MIDPEKYVEAGQALVMLGRTIQRHFPPPNVDGCQYDERRVLEKLLPESTGIFVDIGAHHPTDCSNTINFYRRGWRGLLIEPLPEAWPGLLLERRRDRLCPMACSDREGYATLRKCRSISSLREDWPVDGDETIPVQTARLSTILEMYASEFDWSKAEFASVDCEGSELEVIKGWDFNQFHPRVICIEWASPTAEDLSGPWHPILEANGYKVAHQNILNRIYQRT